MRRKEVNKGEGEKRRERGKEEKGRDVQIETI